MHAYQPEKILIEEEVLDYPLTRRIQDYFPETPQEIIGDYRHHKEPNPITMAKRCLAVVRHRGDALKPFPKVENAINLGDYVFNPVSNCHFECTYCILQSYLQNNPFLTLFANTEDFLRAIEAKVAAQPEKTFRLGTGELSDSLALDGMTQLSRAFVPLFAGLPNAFLEYKTKSNCIENLTALDSKGHTVVSWSLSPETIVRREELKCASLQQRLESARKMQAAGYPVGLHLDPMIYFEGWEEAYRDLIAQIAKYLDPTRIAWVSLGTLRFDKGLKSVASQRFPRTEIFSNDFILSPEGKLRYFKTLRLAMYRQVWRDLWDWSQDFPRYLCMEPSWMWEKATGEAAPRPEAIEAQLIRRLYELQS